MSALFSPVRIGSFEAPNRLWLPAMVTWLSNEAGEVTEAVRDRYVRYARGGVGTMVLEAMGVRDVASGPLMRIGHDRYVPGLRDLVARVKDAGDTRVMPQVIDFLRIARRDPTRTLARLEAGHPGCSTWTEDELRARLSPRAWRDYAWGWREQIEDLSDDAVRAIPGYFAAAARRAREAGFDGVELHFAHAYTVASFLSATNRRDDEWGGPLEHRARLALDIVAAVRAEVGRDFTVGCRILGSDAVPGGSDVADACVLGAWLAAAGLDFVSVSRGGRFEDAKRPAVGKAAYPYTGPSGEACMPGPDAPEGVNLPYAAAVRAAVRASGLDVPIVGAGRIHTVQGAEDALRRGACDLVGMARALLADPDWPMKARDGHGDTIRTCRYTNVCEAFDRAHLPVRCQLWMKHPSGGLHPPD